ncbi:uncharacterized protein TNCV_84591 [Trichonephila clavipes]|nr:uncharacterized protein TNCV_84591 [Trichonephila clavipes]
MYSRHHCKRYHRWAAVNGMQRSGRRANRPSLCRRLATEKRDTCREATRSMSSSSLFSPEEGSDLSDLSDDDNAANKTYELRILEGESSLAVANSWFLCKQDAISNKIPLKIKMDHLKFKLEIVEALSASPPTNRSILANDEDNSVIIPLAKRSKCYNPPAIHVMAFILAISG